MTQLHLQKLGPVKLQDSDDYTFHLRRDVPEEAGQFKAVESVIAEGINATNPAESPRMRAYAYADRAILEGEAGRIEGRVLACSCFEGREYSVTVRSGRDDRRLNEGSHWGTPPNTPTGTTWATRYKAGGQTPGYAISGSAICDVLYSLIFREGTPHHGLVVIAGGTGSLKSQVARGLIDMHLRRLRGDSIAGRGEGNNRPRRPHLVTFEDPVERYFTGDNDSESAARLGIDYTPRQKDIDVKDLTGAIRDALRQKPACFYVGEVRDMADWPTLLEFAGTGHLVVTTTHSGSLVEALDRILTAVRARAPADWDHYGRRLLGVVHNLVADVGERGGRGLIPALWRSTPAGLTALVGDGLSSVLPNNPCEQAGEQFSSIGRRWFIERLIADEAVRAGFLKQAVDYDLRGI